MRSIIDGGTDASANARPLLRGLAAANRFNPRASAHGPNDGFVTERSMSFGRQLLPLRRRYDHAGIVEDPSVVDAIAIALGRQR